MFLYFYVSLSLTSGRYERQDIIQIAHKRLPGEGSVVKILLREKKEECKPF
jgi:hypothetical protein